MNRAIKFRGKRVDNGEWVYGAYFCLHHNDERTHIHHFIIPDDVPIPKDKPIGEIQVEVIPETVGQFTGLVDKNGIEIYEADIVRDVIQRVGYIIFLSQEMAYTIVFKKYDRRLSTMEITNNLIVKIGNIHDNPELMNK